MLILYKNDCLHFTFRILSTLTKDMLDKDLNIVRKDYPYENKMRICYFCIFVFAFLCLLFFTDSIAYAQTGKVFLSGHVVDKDTHLSIPFASVRLFSLPDSTMIAGGTTDNDGKFSFSAVLKQGKNYQLNIFYIGYTSFNQLLPEQNQKSNLNLGDIILSQGNIDLNAAVVTAKAPLEVTVEDTTVYNTSAYRTPEGSMLEELVKQLPGSEITDDGKLVIHGKEVKKILVDGKEFFFDDPQAAMKNFPVEMIEKMKAYERKSDLARLTGIDDGEGEMILDLSVKKDMKKGWRENFLGGVGSKQRFEIANTYNRFRDNSQLTVIGNLNNTNNQGFSELQQQSSASTGDTRSRNGIATSRSFGLNFSRDWENVKLRSNVQYSGVNRSQIPRSTTDNFLRADKSISKGNSDDGNRSHNLTANLSLEWQLDSLSTLIFRPQYHRSTSNRESKNFQQSWANDTLVNDKTSSNNGNNWQYDTGFMLQLSRKLSRTGRNVALSVNYGFNASSSDRYSYSTINYYRRNTKKVLNQKIHNETDGNNYRVQFVYVEPLPWAHFLQFRYSYQYRVNNSDRFVYDWDTNQNDFYADCDTVTSNSFENQYSNHLFNLAIRTSRLKYNYNFGFDLEPQRSTSHSFLGDVSKNRFTKQVYNFSPTANFIYKFSKRTRLNITYRGTSRQPNIFDLQPIVDTTNPLYIRVGNPSLKPSYTNTFMLNYNSYNIKHQSNMVVTLLGENTLNNVTSQVTYDSNTGVRTTTPVNLNGNWRAQGTFSLNTPFANKCWIFRTNSYMQFSNQNGYTTINNGDPQKTSVEHLTARQRLQMTYRTQPFEASVRGSVLYNNSYNNVRDSRTETYDYSAGGSVQCYLPWNLEFFSDITYNLRLGYGYTGSNLRNWMWNCQLSASFFHRKQLTLRLKIYDILRQENSLFRNISSTAIRDVEYNALGSYVMLHAIVRINMMGKRRTRR